uniref:Uncharacterized protein n=1 Tax=Romanomermis culicivorax TaxID=13658 RepID=A0A915K6U1_ROMCU
MGGTLYVTILHPSSLEQQGPLVHLPVLGGFLGDAGAVTSPANVRVDVTIPTRVLQKRPGLEPMTRRNINPMDLMLHATALHPYPLEATGASGSVSSIDGLPEGARAVPPLTNFGVGVSIPTSLNKTGQVWNPRIGSNINPMGGMPSSS